MAIIYRVVRTSGVGRRKNLWGNTEKIRRRRRRMRMRMRIRMSERMSALLAAGVGAKAITSKVTRCLAKQALCPELRYLEWW